MVNIPVTDFMWLYNKQKYYTGILVILKKLDKQ